MPINPSNYKINITIDGNETDILKNITIGHKNAILNPLEVDLTVNTEAIEESNNQTV